MSMKKRLAAAERMRPPSGASVVGVDTFEPPGEELYLISHHETKAEADAAAKVARRTHEIVHVYEAG